MTWIEDGEEHSASYSIMGEGILKITENGEDSFIKVFSLNTYNSNGDAERNFYAEHFEFEGDLVIDEYESFRYGWHSYYEVTNSNGNGGEIEIIFADEESAENSEYYQYLVSRWNSSSLNPANKQDEENEGDAEEHDDVDDIDDSEEVADDIDEVIDENQEDAGDTANNEDGGDADDIDDSEEVADDIDEDVDENQEDAGDTANNEDDGDTDDIGETDVIGDADDIGDDSNTLDSLDYNNLKAAISDWDSADQDELHGYIQGLYDAIDTRTKIAASIELLEWALTNRTLQDGDNLSSTSLPFKAPDTLNWDLPQVQNMVNLLIEIHAIGDAGVDNSQLVQDFLSAFRDSTALSNVVDGDTILTESFGVLLNDLLGDNRGWVDDLESNRNNDLGQVLDSESNGDGRTYQFGSDDSKVHLEVLAGHTNTLSGTIEDLDAHVDEVDVTIITSGRDTIITSDLTIQTPDSAKEDAYVIAAADELYLRGEWSDANHQTMYENPTPLDIELKIHPALAAIDEMNLVDVDITTGGSLAIASLDELNIWSTGASGNNEFTVGADIGEDDFEGLFLYGQNLIKINGLDIQGRVDDIYMEAYTISLENVTFPLHLPYYYALSSVTQHT